MRRRTTDDAPFVYTDNPDADMRVKPLAEFLHFSSFMPYASTSCFYVFLYLLINKHEKNRFIAVENSKQVEVVEDMGRRRAVVEKMPEKSTESTSKCGWEA
jgi:hypothetical protein